MTCVILCMYSAVEDLYHYQRYIKNKYYYYYYYYLLTCYNPSVEPLEKPSGTDQCKLNLFTY